MTEKLRWKDRVGEHEFDRLRQRARRKREVRAKTISMKRLSKTELEAGRRAYPEETAHLRPKTRGECVNGPRPCPWVSCRHHLYLDVTPRGSIQLNFPDLEVWELAESCSLDIADKDHFELEGIGARLNVTRECVRKVGMNALSEIERRGDLSELVADEDRPGRGKRVRLRVWQQPEWEFTEAGGSAQSDDERGAA